jgi:hypothetical protein
MAFIMPMWRFSFSFFHQSQYIYTRVYVSASSGRHWLGTSTDHAPSEICDDVNFLYFSCQSLSVLLCCVDRIRVLANPTFRSVAEGQPDRGSSHARGHVLTAEIGDEENGRTRRENSPEFRTGKEDSSQCFSLVHTYPL